MSDSIFPRPGVMAPHPDRDTYEWTGSAGLSKRELFAALAMQGLLAAVYSSKEMLNEFTTNERGKYPAHVTGAKAISENAVSYADALIAELAKAATSSEPIAADNKKERGGGAGI